MKNFRHYALFWALVISGALVTLSGSGMKLPEESRTAEVVGHSEILPEQEAVTQPDPQPATEPVTETTEAPATEAVNDSFGETAPTGPLAVYGEDESYFDDALFIGDSRTDGLRLYSPIGEASYFCTTGMTVFDVFEVKAPNKEFVEQTLEEVLEERKFGKIYITLALNELSEEDELLREEFQAVLNRLGELQPQAKLVLHAVMPLGKEKSASESYFSMERITQVNELLRSVAEDMDCCYLDASGLFAGEDGYLKEELSYDGCHLYARNYWMWAQFLCENAV